ncbi:MAG: hypothetical protein Kow0080_03420 [Candidatus Promineifilaceae bacterium]
MKSSKIISRLQPRIEEIDRWRYQKIAHYCQGSVLDVACGLKGLSEFITQDKYLGCDLNGGDVIASIYSLPFPDNSFDTVVLGEVLEHLDMPLVALSEAGRVSRHRIVVTVPNNYSLVRLARLFLNRYVDIEEEHILSLNAWNLKILFERIGFQLVERFCFPLRLQLLPELPIKSRFGYWLFVIADRKSTK